jgi:putative ABC transport system permease protein
MGPPSLVSWACAHALQGLAGLPEDQYHFPIILQPYAVASCAGILIASAAVSSFLVWQRIKKLDLVSVLKVRE